MASPMANRFGNKFAPQTPPKTGGYQYDIEVDGETRSYSFDEPLTEAGLRAFRKKQGLRTRGPRRVRRKIKKTKEEKERLEIKRARREAAEKAAVEDRRKKAADAVPQVLEQQAAASIPVDYGQDDPTGAAYGGQFETGSSDYKIRGMLADAMRSSEPPVNAQPQVANPVADQVANQVVPAAQAAPVVDPGDPAIMNQEYGAAYQAPPAAVAAAPGVDAMAQQQAAQAAKPSPTQQLNQFSKDYLGKVSMRKRIMQSLTAAFGGEDISDIYEKEAIAKYTNYVNNQAGKIAIGGGHDTEASFMAAFLDAGGDLDSAIKLGNSLEFGTQHPDLDYKHYTFTNPSDPTDQRMGYIIEEDGKAPIYLMRGEGGAMTEVPQGWSGKSGAAATSTVNIGGEKMTEGQPKAMMKRARIVVGKVRNFWLNEDGTLKKERDFWDTTGAFGEARSMDLQLQQALMSVLRLESGAAIGIDEKEAFFDLYRPNKSDWAFGDTEAVIKMKFDNMLAYLEEMELLTSGGKTTEEEGKQIMRLLTAEAKAEMEAAQGGGKPNRFQQIEEGG